MPRAVVDISETHDCPLKSLEGGFVKLRRLPYGSWLRRQEMAMQMKMRGMGRNEEAEGVVAMANRAVTEFEFRECIVDHNLTDNNDAPLDFRKSFTLDLLNPRVGNEIARYISTLHDFEEDLGNSLNGSTPVSS